jgi:tetratricopeptide (TPR) repeat protein
MKNPDSPQNWLNSGKKAYQKKKYAEAAEFFSQAAQEFAKNGEVILAAEAANNWSVAALQAGDRQNAFLAVEGTAEIFAEAGDIQRQGIAYGNLGAAYEALGHLDEAIVSFEQSSILLKEAGDNEMRQHVMQALSALQLKTGKQLQALATLQAGLEGLESKSPKQKFIQKLLDIPMKQLSGH